MSAAAVLQVRRLEAAYDDSHVLFGVSFEMAAGEVVSLLGRNGMGKTTTISSITGILPPRGGKVFIGGVEVTGWPSFRIARRGVGLVPEGRQIFPNLTVRENLLAMAGNWIGKPDPWDLETTLDLFPTLRTRLDSSGSVLSGGEQQMLAIGRALMTNPQLLILDEATEGLAPLIREQIWRVLARLKAAGQSILIVDKNIKALGRIADRHYVLEKGRIIWSGGTAELREHPELQRRYLGV
jgi:branched-chain amino acid transport system ATP-binding protein